MNDARTAWNELKATMAAGSGSAEITSANDVLAVQEFIGSRLGDWTACLVSRYIAIGYKKHSTIFDEIGGWFGKGGLTGAEASCQAEIPKALREPWFGGDPVGGALDYVAVELGPEIADDCRAWAERKGAQVQDQKKQQSQEDIDKGVDAALDAAKPVAFGAVGLVVLAVIVFAAVKAA